MSHLIIKNAACEKEINTRTVQTTCAYCGVGCGIRAQVNDNDRSVQIIGNDQHPSNYGRLCGKGNTLGQTTGLNERLLDPYINNKVSTWDNALNYVADGFQKVIDEHGPDSVAFYASGQLLTEDYYVANKLMKGFIGSGNIDTNSRLCMSSSVVGHKRAFGTDTVPGCYEDFEHANLIILVGSNTAWCHPILFQRIKAHKEKNPHVKVVVIDPRKTDTCDIADLHLAINLGSDVWLFNGLLHYLNEHKNIDHDYINKYCQGFDESLMAAQKSSGDLTATAKTLGINEADLTAFYECFASTHKVVTLYSQGVNQSSSGTDKVNSITNVHLATGRIGREGMGPFSMTGQPNAMGGRDVGGLANTLAGHMDFTDDNIDRLKRFWNAPNITQQQGLMAVDLFDAILAGKIKAVWIMATNPMVSLPDTNKVKAALEKCELVVVSDCIAKTDTMDMAHVKLPAMPWSEKDGTVTNSERRISRQRALFEPAGNSKADWWMVCEVAKRLGHTDGFNFNNSAAIFREHAALSGFENTDPATSKNGRLRDFDISLLQNINDTEYDNFQPKQWPINSENPNGMARFFAKGNFFTKNRKANLLALTPKLGKNLSDKTYPLILNTGRIRDQWHTMSRTGLVSQLNQHISEPFVQVHPDNAHGLQDGQIIQVQSRWGKMMGRLIITRDVKPNEIFAPMHWTSQLSKQGRINLVVNPVVDEFSKQPESKYTPVKIMSFDAKCHGFILNRQTTNWPNLDYVVEIKGKQQQRYEFAHSQAMENPMDTLLLQLGFKNEQAVKDMGLELLSYQDTVTGIYRLGIVNKGGQLQALSFISPKLDLPDRTWLASLFEKETLNKRDRTSLLSGYAPSGEDMGKIICACFSVGEKTIQKAIKEHGCKTPADIAKHIKAGGNCGSCVPEIKQIIAKAT